MQDTTRRPQGTHTDYSTSHRRSVASADPRAGVGWALALTAAALGLLGLLAWLLPEASSVAGGPGLGVPGLLTLAVFGIAVVAWCSGRFDDLRVALTAAVAMVLLGVLDPEDLFDSFGAEPIWLLLSAFLLAAGLTRTGLPARLVVALVARARSPRQLAHLTTLALVVSALLVPSTSGRAALAVPVHAALTDVFGPRVRLTRALALLFPTVILLSAVASLVGAGAHLITSQILAATTGTGIGFAQWLVWGLPLAVASSHLATELILLLFTGKPDRDEPTVVSREQLRHRLDLPDSWRRNEILAAVLLGVVAVAWCTADQHGIPAPVVAFAASLVLTAPRSATVPLSTAFAEVPWSLLLFMATTAALGGALTSSGAAQWLASHLLVTSGPALVVGVVVVSAAAHLVLQSRSARSSVLIPIVIPAALVAGLDPVALAFASTAAAGFCHTLTSSAKPVAVFARLDATPTFTAKDLLVLSAWLGPLLVGLVLLFSFVLWPYLGLPLH